MITYLQSKEKRVVMGGGKENYFGKRVQDCIDISDGDKRALVPARSLREEMLGGCRETKISHLFGSLPIKALE